MRVEFKYSRAEELEKYIRLIKANYTIKRISEPKVGEKFIKLYIEFF